MNLIGQTVHNNIQPDTMAASQSKREREQKWQAKQEYNMLDCSWNFSKYYTDFCAYMDSQKIAIYLSWRINTVTKS